MFVTTTARTSMTTQRLVSIPEDPSRPVDELASAVIAMAATEGAAGLDASGRVCLLCDRTSTQRERFTLVVGGQPGQRLSARSAHEALVAHLAS